MKTLRARYPSSHSAQLIFSVVANVEDYPLFVPYCQKLTVISREIKDNKTTLIADMVVAFGPAQETFRSEVLLDPEALRIDVTYVSGPFSCLENHWVFLPDEQGGSLIDFQLDYQFRSVFLSALASMSVDRIFTSMTKAFLKRADDLSSRLLGSDTSKKY